jgi:hypothetical protein
MTFHLNFPYFPPAEVFILANRTSATLYSRALPGNVVLRPAIFVCSR